MRLTLRRTVAIALLGLATSLVVTGTASAAARYFTGRVAARSSNTHYVYVGLDDNYLTVRGDGSTDLDCWVYDEYDRLIDSDRDDTDYCVLSTPGVGRHRLVIRNYGSVYNDYVVRQQR